MGDIVKSEFKFNADTIIFGVIFDFGNSQRKRGMSGVGFREWLPVFYKCPAELLYKECTIGIFICNL